MLSVGLIGAGRWGRVLAGSFSKKCLIKRVATSGNTKNIDSLRKIIPKVEVSSIEEIINDNEIDAVIVASSIETLSDLAVKCLRSKKHVFLEKPAGINLEEIENIIKSKKEKVCLVNYLYLSDPAYVTFKKETSDIKVTEISSFWKKWGTFNNDIVMNLACHDIAMMLDILGENVILRSHRINRDSCFINLSSKETNACIEIDRLSRETKKCVTCHSSNSSLVWQPGKLKLLEIDNETNNCIFEKDVNLVDVQRDRFLSYVQKDNGFSNLNTARKVVNILSEINK